MGSDKVKAELSLLGETHRVEGDWMVLLSGTREGEGARAGETFMGSIGIDGLVQVMDAACKSVWTLADAMGLDGGLALRLLGSAASRMAADPKGQKPVKVVDLAARAEMRRMAEGLGIDADI